MILTLTRFNDTGHETLGLLSLEDGTTYCTLEDSWNDNRPAQSSIPAGTYPCTRREFYHGGYETWHINDVPGRTYILIHRGNTALDTKGCVLIGKRFGVLDGRLAVMASRAAHEDFMDRLKDVSELTLLVKEAYVS